MTRALPDLPGGGGYERQRRTSGAGHPGGAAGDPAADAQVGQLPAVGAGGSVPDVPGAAGKRSQRPAPAGAGGASRRRGHGDGLPRSGDHPDGLGLGMAGGHGGGAGLGGGELSAAAAAGGGLHPGGEAGLPLRRHLLPLYPGHFPAPGVSALGAGGGVPVFAGCFLQQV